MIRCESYKHKPLKKNFTFVEVLIGFVITSLILGMAFTSLYEISVAHARLAKGEREILGRAEFQQRLNAIFSNLVPSPTQTEGYCFYLTQNTEEASELRVKFWCGIDPDPSFSDQVLGIFELKKQGFCLRVVGNNPSSPEREEILRRSVITVEYEFLSDGTASTTWDKDKASPPNYLKITLIFEDGKEEVYVFWINKQPMGVFIR